jgi:hypothetical protein
MTAASLDKNGFGLNLAETDSIAPEIERDFQFLPDSQAVHDRWRRLLVEHEVKGVQVHDTSIAASIYFHSIPQLLTINVRDLGRFPGLNILHPTDVMGERTL